MNGVCRLLFDWFGELDSPLKPMILEKTTANAVRMRWLQRAFPEAAFLGVVRNGYAVVEGIKRKGSKPVERGARHWRRVNEIMLSDATQVKRFMLIRYEDFVAAPRDSLNKIAEFLDLRLDDSRAEYSRIDRGSADGSPAAIRDMNAESIRRRDEAEIRAITHEAGEVLARLGYTRLPETR
jgi:hypothetical protein